MVHDGAGTQGHNGLGWEVIVRKTWISQEMSGRPTGEESGVALHDEIEKCCDERPNQIF